MTNAEITTNDPKIKVKTKRFLIKANGERIDITDQEPKQEEPKVEEAHS